MNVNTQNQNNTDEDSMGLNPPHVSSGGTSPELMSGGSVTGGIENQGEMASEKVRRKGEQLPRVPEKTKGAESVKAPEGNPENKQKFENPYKLYGYNPSDNLIKEAEDKRNSNLTGDVYSSRNWLLVLLNRLIQKKN